MDFKGQLSPFLLVLGVFDESFEDFVFFNMPFEFIGCVFMDRGPFGLQVIFFDVHSLRYLVPMILIL